MDGERMVTRKKTNSAAASNVPVASKRATRRRPVAAGDVPPVLQPAAIESFTLQGAVDAAEESRLGAMRDVIAGMSVDESVALLKGLLKQQRMVAGQAAPNPDDELLPDWREGGYPYKNLMQRRNYERQKYRLQVELLKLQAWVKETGQKVVILFEGRDAAGKGGTIQRYVQHLPTNGEIVLFDRSWYNRSGVERVMGFCSDFEYSEFVRQAPEFERMLARNGIHLIKFWFSVSQEEQRRRFGERKLHPLKQWKLSPIDMASLDKWDDYTRAKEAMFLHCDTSDAPWTVIKSDCKKRARLNAMRFVLNRLPYAERKPERVGAVDPLIVGRPALVSAAGDDLLASTGAG